MLGIQTAKVIQGIRIVTGILEIHTAAVILGIQTTSYTRHRDCHSRLGIQITTAI